MPKDVERNMGGARVWLGIDRSFPGFESGTRTPKGLVESGGGRTTELREIVVTWLGVLGVFLREDKAGSWKRMDAARLNGGGGVDRKL